MIDLTKIVKPLVWTPANNGSGRLNLWFEGRCKNKLLHSVVKTWHGQKGEGWTLDGEGFFPTIEAAQSAANADHAARVIAALEVEALETLVGALAEAKVDIGTYVDHDYPPDTCAEFPDIARRHFRDMELCRRIDAILAKLTVTQEQQT